MPIPFRETSTVFERGLLLLSRVSYSSATVRSDTLQNTLFLYRILYMYMYLIVSILIEDLINQPARNYECHGLKVYFQNVFD